MLQPDSFVHTRARVEAMMETGQAFRDVEDAIAASQLSQDEEAALWLMARLLDGRRERSLAGVVS